MSSRVQDLDLVPLANLYTQDLQVRIWNAADKHEKLVLLSDFKTKINDEDATASSVLLKSNNLSDLPNATTARTNLGLAIGTNVQAFDADLSALAALAGTNTLYYRSAANTWSAVTIGTSLDFTGGALAVTGLVIGTNVQAHDADLDALAALSGTNTMYYRSAANTWSAVTIGSNLAFSTGTLAVTNVEPLGQFFAINGQSGASYTLVLTDAGKLVETNNASANTLTVPPNSSVAFPVNTRIDLAQYGAGQTTVVAGGGVTIRSAGGKLKFTGQYSAGSLYKRATDEWVLIGDLSA